jgi:hypothetical protein
MNFGLFSLCWLAKKQSKNHACCAKTPDLTISAPLRERSIKRRAASATPLF